MINEWLTLVESRNASDLHLIRNAVPVIRIDGLLSPLEGQPILTIELLHELVRELTAGKNVKAGKDIDFAYSHGENARYRVNIYYQKGSPAIAMRLIPKAIPTIDSLGLPPVLKDICKLPQGFVLVCGPTGQGKSTTLASMIREINETRNAHILTIEDPIEYVYEHGKSIISQREVGEDTESFAAALRGALREDPNIILVGEMRDYETVGNALTLAETGHLVFATLHTNSAAQSIDRMVDVFPAEEQTRVRVQLAQALEAVLSQRLIRKRGGGRVAAVEVLMATDAVRTIIREAKTYQLDNVISTSVDVGMISLERSLASFVRQGLIGQDEAMKVTLRPEELTRLLKR